MTYALCALCIDVSSILPLFSLTRGALLTAGHCVTCEYHMLILQAVLTETIHDRTKEHLSRVIQQGGGSKGHSSVEDSVASLDLVKWFVLNKKTKPTIATVGTSGGGSGGGGRNNNKSVDIGGGAP